MNLQGVFNERATQVELFDHFLDADCKSRWNTKETDANADVTLQTDGRGGIMNINAATDLNAEAYIYSNAVFKWNGDLPMLAQGRLVGDADTSNAYSWVFGFADSTGFSSGDMIANGGLSLIGSLDLACFFKPYNTNRLSVVTVQSATGAYKITETESVQTPDTPGSGIEYVSLKVDVHPRADDDFDVMYFVDENGGLGFQPCMDLLTHKPIKHRVNYDPSGKISVGAGLKNGKASEAAIVRIDYMGGVHQAHRNYGDS
jgi:hypothetical protein